MPSTSNSSTSQVDIIRNPKVNNLIISSAQRLVCRRSDSRKSAAQIRAGKMPDFKKETGRDPEERMLPNPSLVTYFGPSVLQLMFPIQSFSAFEPPLYRVKNNNVQLLVLPHK